MRRLTVAFLGLALLAALVIPLAQGGVSRYQFEYATLTVTLPAYGYHHVYEITVNPCDSSFTGAGNALEFPSNETISGTLGATDIAFEAVYGPGAVVYPYHWDYSGPLSGGTATDSEGGSFAVTSALTDVSFSSYKNHGDYVSSSPKGSRDDAAHSCIGMPVNSGK